MSKQVTVAIAGLGSRGKDTYAPTAKMFPDKMKIVAIADIIPEKVADVAKEYNIPESACYTSAEEMLKEDKLADVMFICTQDRQHVKQGIPALRKGYDLLMEKPISPDLDDCRECVKVANELGRKIVVCHVLRYTPYYTKLKEVIDSGAIGEIVDIMALENVLYWHQAHSFVRGNWRNSNTTSPMILQKCCHDFDLLLWLSGKTCDSVSSFGSTYYFKKENAPEGATPYCMGGCRAKKDCPYDAEKIYITNDRTGVAKGKTGWPADVVAQHPTVENVTEAIKTGPYGRCVYMCDNNVVDHQVVNMNMTDGTTMTLTMCAFDTTGSRYQKFMGTKGEIIADLSKNTINVTTFGGKTEVIDVSKLAADFSGHAGGDSRMVEEFLDMVAEGKEPQGNITSIDRSMESHYCALAAEKSRLNDGEVVKLDTLRK